MSYQYNEAADHVKNFRPQCLVLCGPPESHGELVHLVSHVTRNNGLMICGEVSNMESTGSKSDRKKATDWLRDNKIKAFHCICTGIYTFAFKNHNTGRAVAKRLMKEGVCHRIC